MSAQKITVQIGGAIAASLGKSLKTAQTQVSTFGRNVDRAVGDSMKSANASFKAVLGNNLYRLSAGAGVAVGAISTGLFKLGKDFDQAFDTIRIGTGATGKALDGLKDDFRAVFRSTPADMQTVGQAIADLNTRTGLAGKPLQALTRQMVNLEQLGQGLAQENIPTLTRVLGDWGVSSDDTGSSMDKLFRASQATGPSMSRLGEKMVQFGAPLRQMGFGFEEAAAMVGKFEKEGVNTELVMGSLRISLGKMAKAGVKDIPKAFRASLKAIKEATTAGEANAKAMELFGAKAGPDMAAAIREGRFEIDALVKQIKSGKDTINSVAFETADASEKFKIIRNDLAVAMEPMANNVFAALGDTLDALMPTIKAVTNEIAYFAKTNPKATTAIIGLTAGLLGFVAIAPMIASTIAVVKSLKLFIGGLKLGATIAGWAAVAGPAIGMLKAGLIALTGPIGLTVAAIIGVGLAIKAVVDYWPEISTAATRAWWQIKAVWGKFASWMGNLFNQALTVIGKWAPQALAIMFPIPALVLGAFGKLPTGVQGIFNRIIAFIKDTPRKIAGVGELVIKAILDGLKAKATELFGWIGGTWNRIKSFVGGGGGETTGPGGGPAAQGAAPAAGGGISPIFTPPGGGISPIFTPPGRAMGGPVRAGFPYVVGERRRELFVPGMDGAIVPKVARPVTAAALAGLLAAPLPAAAAGGAITVHAPVTINAAGGDPMEIRRQVEMAFVDIQREIESSHRVLLND